MRSQPEEVPPMTVCVLLAGLVWVAHQTTRGDARPVTGSTPTRLPGQTGPPPTRLPRAWWQPGFRQARVKPRRPRLPASKVLVEMEPAEVVARWPSLAPLVALAEAVETLLKPWETR
jgi:hypothetical protein